jgi:hypothetical protein
MPSHRIPLAALLALAAASAASPRAARAQPAPGIGNVPQGTQADGAYAASNAAAGVQSVMVTSQQASAYTPEVPYFAVGIGDGYSGMTPLATPATGEAVGPYATQQGSNPGFPAATPMLVKDHSESDIRIDPTNPSHVIGSSKWFVSAEGYNHILGFYESWDGGVTWPTQGHIPGYEGWTDNTDPVGAFDGYGNYYELILAYDFFYKADGSHSFSVSQSQNPNPTIPAEVVAVAVRPRGAVGPNAWLTTVGGRPDVLASTNATGQGPDKQWITIDTNPASPFYNTIYAMWVVFDAQYSCKPYFSTARALPDGTHTAWSSPARLPTLSGTSADTYLLPHVAPDGTVYCPMAHFPSAQKRSTGALAVISSRDGGATWQGPLVAVPHVTLTTSGFANTTFRDGITETFAVGTRRAATGFFPLYMAWEDYSTGFMNVLLAASTDGGSTWTAPIQVNDNATPVDEFQPNLAVSPAGRVSVAFYDRRLPAPAAGSAEAAAAGLALDPNLPYGFTNYCVDASVQFYDAALTPLGNNIRLTAHSWDPQLNAPMESGETFIGDYFGNTCGDGVNFSTFVSTYDDGSNPAHRQQQVVARVPIP